MKHICILATGLCLMMFFCACDPNVSKVKDISTEFIKAANNNDRATYCELYPTLRSANDIEVVNGLSDKDLSVEQIKEDLYEVKVGEDKTLVCGIEDGECKIVDSHKVIDFPEVYSDIASKTGMPFSKLSDKKILKQLGEKGEFLNYLASKNWNWESLFLTVSNGRYNWGISNGVCYTKMTNNVTNNGKYRVSGGDYEVEFTLHQRSTGNELQKVSAWGQDIEPGATITTQNDVNHLYSIAKDSDIYWDSKIKPKKSKIYLLNKYCTFEGNEYSKFEGKVVEE